ncbi:hypothetical protein PanWU01x14_041250 [Parasponia andersonii]|uniref:Uncharacterized protein n=1 Tax=Parasponia andersonii TaxID=3476 RepID=A0A2P5DQE5_PARAD|nr:hypothetical protein PanWU01x14_041250 [Parasponia andersonii]
MRFMFSNIPTTIIAITGGGRSRRGFTMPPKMKQKRLEKGPRDTSGTEGGGRVVVGDNTMDPNDDILDRGNQRVTTHHPQRALTSPILLKTRWRSESGRRSKWSIIPMSMAMESVLGILCKSDLGAWLTFLESGRDEAKWGSNG